MYSHILVAIDGSELSLLALDHAWSLSQQLSARLTVLNVLPNLPLMLNMAEGVDFRALELDLKKDAEYVVDLAKQHLNQPDLNTKILATIDRSIPETIVRAAEKEQADLIVLATHGHTGLRHFLLGSVAEQVVRHAHIPVLLVREPAQTATSSS